MADFQKKIISVDAKSETTHVGVIGRIRSTVRRSLISVIDKGWFGLQPLQTHVVICGFPRSGSTLLLLIIESCVANIKCFARERPALGWHAQNEIRNHPFLVSKKPDDVLWVDEIRELYFARQAKVQFVLTMRDPRAILTSFHSRFGNKYYVTPRRWQNTYQYFKSASKYNDSVIIKYENLICNPLSVQKLLSERIGWKNHLDFDQFYTNASPNFRGDALNNLRPLDRSSIDKWKHAKHKKRIIDLLEELPDLPDILIDMGYENDKKWIEYYK